MSMNDPIADMFVRIRNGLQAKHPAVHCPASKLKLAIADLLQEEGYLNDVRAEGEGPQQDLVIELKYADDKPVIDELRRISKPSCRIYAKADEIPSVRNGLGIAVLSTSKGLLSDREAREQHIGGEVLCQVW
mgnify:CR=1 FL=1